MTVNPVWAYVAHKDGYWAGVSAPDLQGIGKWISGFIKSGFTVTSVKDRDEYNAVLKELRPWSESDEWKAKYSKKHKAK